MCQRPPGFWARLRLGRARPRAIAGASFLPAPTRAKPFPEAAAVASAQKLERLHREICVLEQFIHQLPAPANDRMTQRTGLKRQRSRI